MVADLPAEVPLPRAPLARVVAQLRFLMIASIENPAFIAPFQEAIRSEYRVMRQEHVQTVALGPGGFRSAESQTAWRFHDDDEQWRVSLTREFLAIDTTAYKSRADFLARLRRLVGALETSIHPAHVDRLGIRYIARVRAPELGSIAKLVREEVRGIVSTAAAKHMQHCLTESRFAAEDAELIARWGHLPTNVTIDPMALEPVAEPSWILDLDMFSNKPIDLQADSVVREAERFAKRIYTFFRWAVTDDFLVSYGGKP